MKKIVIITQKVDSDDDLLGFFVKWLDEFSKKFDRVDVITLMAGSYNLPSNVFIHSLGKEKNSFRLLRFFRFYKFIFSLVPGSAGVFSHMSPIFSIASWPSTFLFRKKNILWYLHKSVTTRLKLAYLLSNQIVTANKDSLKISDPKNKIIEVGHGIDLDYFKSNKDWAKKEKLNILSVGRISPIKDFETLIKAAKILNNKGINLSIKIVGKPVMPGDEEYLYKINKLSKELGVDRYMDFVGFIPHSDIKQYYKEADFVVGQAPTGGIDKTILEGMAMGAITLTSNKVFGKYFGQFKEMLVFEHSNQVDLADKIFQIYQLNMTDKNLISKSLIESVTRSHDLKNTINLISNLY